MIEEINKKISELQAKAQEIRDMIGFKPFILSGIVAIPVDWFSKKEEKSAEEKQLDKIEKEIDELEAQKKSIRNERLEKIKDPNRLITVDYLKSIVQSLEIEYLVITYCAQNQIAYVTSEGKPNAIYSKVGVDSEVYTGLTVRAN